MKLHISQRVVNNELDADGDYGRIVIKVDVRKEYVVALSAHEYWITENEEEMDAPTDLQEAIIHLARPVTGDCMQVDDKFSVYTEDNELKILIWFDKDKDGKKVGCCLDVVR